MRCSMHFSTTANTVLFLECASRISRTTFKAKANKRAAIITHL